MASPAVPDYAGRCLGNVLPAVAARLKVPGFTADPFGLPGSDRWIVFLVDGMGWELVVANLAAAPALAGLMDQAQEITTGVPSTTAAAIASLGTGLPPGGHGVVGYRFFDRTLGGYFAPLSWKPPLVAEQVQPWPTLLERAEAAGVAVTRVVPPDHVGSGFSQAALRGGRGIGVAEDDAAGWAAAVSAAAQAGPRTLVYTYDRSLDHIGHTAGVASPRWLDALTALDRRIERLSAQLTPEVRLVVVADHGMTDVPRGQRVHIEQTPDLDAGVRHVGGEARFRHLYTKEPAAVAARWRDRLGERAWVRTKDEAIAEGWFGPVADFARPRLGDVIAAAAGDWAFLSRRTPVEAKLVAMHGSLTRREMAVPLFLA
jgi:hypothetical protein